MTRGACLIAVLLLLLPGIAGAQEDRITTRGDFLDRVAGRPLSRLGIGIRVTPGGQITGNAFGATVTGSWEWSGRMFCREMAWGSRSWDRECQAVFLREGRVYFQARDGDSVYLNLP